MADNKFIIDVSMKSLYYTQMNFQKKLISKYGYKSKSSENILELPVDDVEIAQYHLIAMSEELGELVKADKRWKTHRNERYEPDEKLDEIADVFITAMNIAIHSGFTADEIEEAISNKIKENYERLKVEKKEEIV